MAKPIILFVAPPTDAQSVRGAPKGAYAGYKPSVTGVVVTSKAGRYLFAHADDGTGILSEAGAAESIWDITYGSQVASESYPETLLQASGIQTNVVPDLEDALASAIAILVSAGWNEGDELSIEKGTLPVLSELRASANNITRAPGSSSESDGDEGAPNGTNEEI
jgi:hypothetical protein